MRTIHFDASSKTLDLIDQTRLPLETTLVPCRTADDVADAIRTMKVRGAPAIGVTAAYGLALGADALETADVESFLNGVRTCAEMLRATRPTAVNLAWAIERAEELAARTAQSQGVDAAKAALFRLADDLAEDDVAINKRMGSFGSDLVPARANVLTHCNTGALATVDYGTALGVIRTAHEGGKDVHVWVDETRPFLQGSRLTAWELQQLGIPMTLITDNMAGHFMGRGQVDVIFVGADRIAANGDTANKIGTYSLAILAREHGVPFYVVAPTSTVDLSIPDGSHIPIEERSVREVVEVGGARIAPDGVQAAHPAFDVTPARYISAIVTERGVLRPPFEPALRAAVEVARKVPPAEARSA